MARPSAVLFACNLNRVRSPMAEGLLRRLRGSAIVAASCGIHRDPADSHGGGPDPFLCAVMNEVDVDLAAHRSKDFADLEDRSFAVVISLTPEAHGHAAELARRLGFATEYWPIGDPTLANGSREVILAAYREVRDDLERRIRARFPFPHGSV